MNRVNMERTGSDILDEILVLAAQDGDSRAISMLVERWHPRLVRHAGCLLGDHERGKDAAQEAWVSIVRKLGGLRDPARFGAWAQRIVTNKCRDEARRRARSVELRAADSRAVSVPMPDENTEEIERLRHGLRHLSGDQRALLALRYVDGLTIPAIAGVLGVPEGTIKSRLHAARDALGRVFVADRAV